MWLGLWSALGIERGIRRDDLHEGLTEGGGLRHQGTMPSYLNTNTRVLSWKALLDLIDHIHCLVSKGEIRGPHEPKREMWNQA